MRVNFLLFVFFLGELGQGILDDGQGEKTEVKEGREETIG